MVDCISEAKEAGDTVGGIFEIIAAGVPIGIGSHVNWDRKLDARVAGSLMSIQAIKGVEFGIGFNYASIPGSQAHDEILYENDKYIHKSNNSGGIEGGISNGEDIVVKAVMKPIPTLYKPLKSIDMATKEPYEAVVERSDVCAVSAASIVGESAAAWEIACAMVEKFGGDSIDEMLSNYRQYIEYVKSR
jgi:chorismate synthase